MKSKKNRLIFAIAVLVTGAGFLSACGPSKADKAEQAQTLKDENAIDTPTVELATVQRGKLLSNITVPGELEPYMEVNLYAKINSYVKDLLVDIGSQVHKGQLLAVLEAPEINSQLAEAQSKIQQNKALYFSSRATYERLYNTSKTPGTVSQNDLDQAKARAQSDSANVEAARSAYKEVAANLAYLQIRAPFDGVITQRNINVGAYVGPGGSSATQPLLVLEDHKRLRLVISVPENFTGGLDGKDEVTFKVRELPDLKFTAQVRRLAGSIDERLRSERLEMDVYNQENKLLPNMYADVNVPLPERDSSLIVPKGAVVTSTEEVFVIRIVNNHAKWVNVEKGLQSKDMAEVYGADLKAGDVIVAKGTDEIRDGSPLKLNSDKKGKGGAAKKDSTNMGGK